ncbi:macro domain-containing protein [Snodgrassella communis]|uniref:macro domain-containing protein n=1 Tax=Snodgrassella communis TaxID=2946699 RepID=UPI001EF5246B|nr:macro domain-containing protein [Snodgrassella communis]WMY92561.1 macro domain-containing protein [Snodgrassella communis]
MQPEIISGDLLEQPVEVIVNAWNRNIIPWWLLLPQGVSGAIKRKAGYAPFRQLGRAGAIKLGSAVVTSAGKLPYQAIIHVAGINMFWRASAYSIRTSVISAMDIVNTQNYASVAFPLIGAGSGGFSPEQALELMQETLLPIKTNARVIIVKYMPT